MKGEPGMTKSVGFVFYIRQEEEGKLHNLPERFHGETHQ